MGRGLRLTEDQYRILLAQREARSKPEKRPSKAVEDENELQRDAQDWLDSKDIWWFHDNDSRKNRPGILDLLICYQGKFVAAELKSKTGKFKEDQLKEMARIRKSGGKTFGARSLSEFIRKLETGVNERHPR
jgi:hypothetical protein